MRKRWYLSVLAASITTIATANVPDNCELLRSETSTICVSYNGGNDCYYRTYEEYYCTPDYSGGGGGDGGGGFYYPPPTNIPPNIRIISASDENPYNPVLSIEAEYTDSIDLYVNGGYRNRYSGTTTRIILPSLKDLSIMGGTGITLTANNASSSSSAVMNIERNWTGVSTDGGIYARYYESNESGEPSVHEANFTRRLTGGIVYTNYSCPPEGQRNGRVFHLSSDDVIAWSALYPTPAWAAVYKISSIGQANNHEEHPCGARIPGGPGNQSALCSTPEEFVFPSATAGTASIGVFRMGDLLDYPTYIVGSDITIQP